MIWISLFLLLMSVVLLYHSAPRYAQQIHTPWKFVFVISKSKWWSRIIPVSFILIAFGIHSYKLGWGVGFMFFLCSMTSLACLCFIGLPLIRVPYWRLSLAFLILALIEFSYAS